MKAATLSSSLLARKGTAGPSHLRPVETGPVELVRPDAPNPKTLEDLPLVARRPTLAPSARDDEEESGRSRPQRVIAIRKSAGAGLKTDHTGRVKMTLRLEPDRHQRLKRVAGQHRRPMQDVMATAVERYLDLLETTAAKTPPKDRSTG